MLVPPTTPPTTAFKCNGVIAAPKHKFRIIEDMAQVGIEMKSASLSPNDLMEHRKMCMTSVAAVTKERVSRVVEIVAMTVVIVIVWGALSLPAIFNYVGLPQVRFNT